MSIIKKLMRCILTTKQYEWCSLKKCSVRRTVFEFFGCGKYSKMGLGGLTDKLNAYLNFKSGIFIEVGANNGVDQSNTYYLERILGWRGYLIEAIPDLSQQCRRSRRKSLVFNCALVAPENHGIMVKIAYDRSSRGLMSKIGSNGEGELVEVAGRTLTDVLDEGKATKIDFFSLDVEGFELEVLKGLDFLKYKPTFILVETEQLKQVDQVLSEWYRRIDQLSFHDYLYKVK
jgi:FkbM family methyltransferase